MAYSQIHKKIWSDQKFRNLSKEQKLSCIYFMCNEHDHQCGLYRLPIAYMAADLNMKEAESKKAIEAVQTVGLIDYDFDTELIWVKNMLKYQANGYERSPSTLKGIQKQIDSLHFSPLIRAFLVRYHLENDIHIYDSPPQGALEGPSGPYTTVTDTVTDTVKERGSGGKPAKANHTGEARQVIDYLNQKTEKQFRYTDGNLELVRARLNEGATFEDCQKVIDVKAAEWKDTENDKYLRPETLFNGKKFEAYRNQKQAVKNKHVQLTDEQIARIWAEDD